MCGFWAGGGARGGGNGTPSPNKLSFIRWSGGEREGGVWPPRQIRAKKTCMAYFFFPVGSCFRRFSLASGCGVPEFRVSVLPKARIFSDLVLIPFVGAPNFEFWDDLGV